MDWKIIDTGTSSAENNMAYDQEMLEQAAIIRRPILRFYSWTKPSATYGYFIDPQRYFKLDQLNTFELDIARRPTGGGILFHTDDLTFSVLIPSTHKAFSNQTLENYRYVNERIIQALLTLEPQLEAPHLLQKQHIEQKQDIPFCMANPTIYDIMISGKKVGGAAQRKTKQGFLHQGSISLSLPAFSLITSVLHQGTSLYECFYKHSYPLFDQSMLSIPRDQYIKQLIYSITHAFTTK
ncbi:MAG: hypothetical protein Tsb0021_12480 [Chlamydiales bacterium]